MTPKAEALLLELLCSIVGASGVYSERIALELKDLIRECSKEKKEQTKKGEICCKD